MQEKALPVVIGSGISGSLISLQLSEENIPHIMVGDLPNNRLRPGESLGLVSTYGLHRYKDVLQDSLLQKTHAAFYHSGNIMNCRMKVNRKIGEVWLKLLGYDQLGNFYHLDRVKSDRLIFEHAIDDPCCHFIEGRVANIEYDEKSDRVTDILLHDGTHLLPDTVFDATNRFAVLPKALNLNWQSLSDPKRLIFGHFCNSVSPQSAALDVPQWDTTTHIVHLTEKIDGINGQAWMIPMHKQVSIGATFDANHLAEKSDEELWQLIEDAFAKRGLDYRKAYPERLPTLAGEVHYGYYKQVYGANWMLSGPTAASYIWTLSGGLNTAYESARMAAWFLKNPAKYGEKYQDSLFKLIPSHMVHIDLIDSFEEPLSAKDALGFGDMLMIRNLSQLSRVSKIHQKWYHRMMGSFLDWFFPNPLVTIRNFCYEGYSREGKPLSNGIDTTTSRNHL